MVTRDPLAGPPLAVACGPVDGSGLADGGEGVVSRLVMFSSEEEEEEGVGEGGGRGVVVDWAESLHLTTSSGGWVQTQ